MGREEELSQHSCRSGMATEGCLAGCNRGWRKLANTAAGQGWPMKVAWLDATEGITMSPTTMDYTMVSLEGPLAQGLLTMGLTQCLNFISQIKYMHKHSINHLQ